MGVAVGLVMVQLSSWMDCSKKFWKLPESGWVQDSESGPAIPFGSGNGWYNYNPAAMVLSPFPGRVLLFRTADGLYAKMRIISYYRGAPDAPDQDSEARYITFEYMIQEDGTRSFE